MTSALLLTGVASAASADDAPERPATLGAGYVYAFDDTDIRFATGDTDDAQGFSLFASYRFNDWLASLVRAEYLDGFEFRYTDTVLSDTDDVRTEIAFASLGVKLFPLAPVTGAILGRVNPYVEASGGFFFAEVGMPRNLQLREYGFAARFAGGVDIGLTDWLELTVAGAYILPTGETQDFRHTTITTGLQYRY